MNEKSNVQCKPHEGEPNNGTPVALPMSRTWKHFDVFATLTSAWQRQPHMQAWCGVLIWMITGSVESNWFHNTPEVFITCFSSTTCTCDTFYGTVHQVMVHIYVLAKTGGGSMQWKWNPLVFTCLHTNVPLHAVCLLGVLLPPAWSMYPSKGSTGSVLHPHTSLSKCTHNWLTARPRWVDLLWVGR